MKRRAVVVGAVLSAMVLDAAVFEHGLYEAVSLDGAWEMAYQPYAHEVVDYPSFRGVTVAQAVPGYWEDMVSAFRAAGMKDEFRINPLFEQQTFPITGWASDTTLPNIYGCFFYRRTVELDRTGPAVLAFEGVRNQVHVWINGRFVAFRAGFSTPFELTVPKGVLKKGANEIVMAVSNNPNLGYGDYVSGLTTRSTFRATGGVNGRLELRFLTGDLADVYVTTAKDLKTFTVHVTGRESFTYAISDGGKVLVQGKGAGDFTLPTEGFAFWSPDSPKRYDLTLTTAQGGVYRQKFGIRRLVADGERFRLNGRPIYLRGVTEHCYFAKTLHLPRDLEYYRMITAKRKELGFNFVRFHTFVPPAEYFEATDELGMVVHVETPNFVSEPEFAAIVAFARRHPSVVIYCTGNETRIDLLAEAYLRDVAEIVHTQTDSLFSPMSAMRGIEYALVPGKDVIVKQPFPHNAERLARVAQYCDMFTSYQLAVTSYDSLNKGTAATLDAWGDAFLGKPRTSHETCIGSSYIDFGLEKLYPPDSPIVKVGLFAEPRRMLTEKGLIDRADTYFRNSCEWMRRIRKHCFEKLRAADRVAGFDFLGDINTHWHTFGYSVGMMDEFYRLKPGETVENVLRYNAAAVVLADLGSDFNLTAGETKTVSFCISNYADDAPDAKLRVTLVDAAGKTVQTEELAVGAVPNGRVSPLGKVAVRMPSAATVEKYLLRAMFVGGKVSAGNEWELYAFPRTAARPTPANVTVRTKMSKAELTAALARGERVLIFGAGPFKALPTTYRIGMAGRCSGNFATIVKAPHPALEGLPHDGYCGWQFRRLMEGGQAVQLEAGIPFDPIIDIASAVKYPIRQAGLFEYRVGSGRLLVCSFRFRDEDPAAAWLRARLVDYAAGDRFEPALSLTPDQLTAVIDAPLLSGAPNQNRARNPGDPSSDVRAGRFAQP